MSSVPLEVNVDLVNQKVQFSVVSNLNPDKPIMMDYFPPLGDSQGYTGLEVLLMSFAGCSSTAIVALLRKMRKNIKVFKVTASATRREQPPTSFDKIHLNFVITSDDIIEADMDKVIKLSEESVCPVWAMIRNNVEVTTEYSIKVS